jgi:hypothetical protein
MSRKQYNSRNNIADVLTFQKSGATSSFDPTITFSSGSRRVSWKLDNGSSITQTAGNSIIYTGFTSDSAIRTIEMRGVGFKNITTFNLSNDNLYNDLNVYKLSGLTNFQVSNNINLTGITHAPSPPSNTFSVYFANNCNIIGNLDLTPLSGLGGQFYVYDNPNLTGITHAPIGFNFSQYYAYNCNLLGNFNMSTTNFTGIGSLFINNNTNLTGLTYLSNFAVDRLKINDCDLTGTLDLSTMLLGNFDTPVNGYVHLQNNPNLTNLILGNYSAPFGNPFGDTIDVSNCNLGYIDFNVLATSSFLSSLGNPATIKLNDNNMSASEVNTILYDFLSNALFNSSNWSNIVLNIGGTNADPDNTSGGYDGLAAIATLTGTYGWTITY